MDGWSVPCSQPAQEVTELRHRDVLGRIRAVTEDRASDVIPQCELQGPAVNFGEEATQHMPMQHQGGLKPLVLEQD